MNAFVRQIAVLSVLWAMCELLLPDGKHQQMVRMMASLLVLTALLSTAGDWISGQQPAETAMTHQIMRATENGYRRMALTAMANQVEGYCVRMAERAGYQAGAAVYLTRDGALDHIELALVQREAVIASSAELAKTLAGQLGVEEERIWLSVEGI